jgi:hypothetical protein
LRQETFPAFDFSRPAAAALYAIAVLLVGSAAVRALVRAHADRMELETGPAEWIWYTSRVPEPRRLRFYATRDFELPAAPSRAMAKLFVDPAHVLYVNGARVGGGLQRRGDPLALYPIARYLKRGVNRVSIEASSPTGIGGILFSLDLDAYGRDAVCTNGSWRVDLSPAAIVDGGRYRPEVWGRPPQYPWAYPRMPRPEEMRLEVP